MGKENTRSAHTPGRFGKIEGNMASNKLTIINAHVIDPASKLDGRYDIVVEDGKISECHPCEGRDPDRLDSRLRGNDNFKKK